MVHRANTTVRVQQFKQECLVKFLNRNLLEPNKPDFFQMYAMKNEDNEQSLHSHKEIKIKRRVSTNPWAQLRWDQVPRRKKNFLLNSQFKTNQRNLWYGTILQKIMCESFIDDYAINYVQIDKFANPVSKSMVMCNLRTGHHTMIIINCFNYDYYSNLPTQLPRLYM